MSVQQVTNFLSHIGWDPIFEYEGKTYAEMDKAEKVSVLDGGNGRLNSICEQPC